MPATVFVLGGGAHLGATQVGMLRALFEHGIEPNAIVGCSVGAINGAAIAAMPSIDGVEFLDTLWHNLDGNTICPKGRLNAIRQLARRYGAAASNHGLRSLLERRLPITRFEETTIPLHVVATSLRTGNEAWLSTGPLVPALLASAAIPAVFPPVVINGEPLIDGAVVNNVPISKAIELGATRIIVLHVGNFSRPRREPTRPLDALIQSFSIARNHRFALDTAQAPSDVELLVLPAVDPGPELSYHDFSQAHTLIARSYRLAADFLESSSQSRIGASAQSLSRS